MKSKMLTAMFMIGMLFVSATVSMEAQAATPTLQKNSQVSGRYKSRKHGKVRKSVSDVGKGTKDTGKGVAKGSETAATATADGAKDVSKATAKGAKKTGKATAKAAKKVGSVFK